MNLLSEYAAIFGIDWADKKHDLCLRLPGDKPLEFSVPGSNMCLAISAPVRATSWCEPKARSGRR